MKRTKIAPTLQALVLTDGGGLATAYPQAGRELRALLAVARVARSDHDGLDDSCIGGYCDVCRALSRLASASEGRGSKT